MNPFTRHPRQQGVTYGEHLRFALGIAWRLSKSVTAFGVHAVLPFVAIPRELDLEATAVYLLRRNRWIQGAAVNGVASQAGDHDPLSAPYFVDG